MALRASVKERRYSPAPHAVRAEVRDIPTPGRGADSAESARNARAMWTLASCRIGPFLLQVNRLQVPQMHQRVQQAAMLWPVASNAAVSQAAVSQATVQPPDRLLYLTAPKKWHMCRDLTSEQDLYALTQSATLGSQTKALLLRLRTLEQAWQSPPFGEALEQPRLKVG